MKKLFLLLFKYILLLLQVTVNPDFISQFAIFMIATTLESHSVTSTSNPLMPSAHRRCRICAAQTATCLACAEQYIITCSKPARHVS